MNQSTMISKPLFFVALLIAFTAAPIRAQEQAPQWWFSPVLGLFASGFNATVAQDLGLARNKGFLVLAVVRKSPADEAGLKPGDIITDWSPRELWWDEGKSGSIQLVRAGVEQTLKATSRKMPAETSLDLIRLASEPRDVTSYVVDPAGAGTFRTLTAAMYRAKAGDTIIVKPGTYTESVFGTPGIQIRAEEKSLARFEIKTSWYFVGPGTVEIAGISFVGDGVEIDNAEQVTISDCEFQLAEKKTGLRIGSSKSVKVMNNSFRGTAQTLGVAASGSQIVVNDCVFTKHGAGAVGLSRTSQAEIQNNLFDKNANGILVYDSELTANKNVMTGNWSVDSKDDQSSYGFRLENSKASLSNNVVRQHRQGIFISNSPVETKITGSTLSQTDYGIVLLDSPANISENLIFQNLRDGVFIGTRAKEPQTKTHVVTIVRNTLSGNERSGIEIRNFRSAAINENLIEANGTGVHLEQSTGTLANNTLVLQRYTAVIVGERSNAEIFNNVVAFNSYGLFFDVTAQSQSGYNNVYGNLASTEFPLRDGNYGRADRYITRDGKRVRVDIYPAYDLQAKTDLSVDPGFVKMGSDYSLTSSSPLTRARGREGRFLGAYAPATFTSKATDSLSPVKRDPRVKSRKRAGAASKAKVSSANSIDASSPNGNENPVLAVSDESTKLVEEGNKFMKRSEWTNALAAYKQAILAAPNNAEAHTALGWAYNMMGRHGDAFAPLVKAIQLNPQSAEAQYGIAYAYLGSENYVKALPFLRAAVRLAPNNAEARHSLGLAYLELGNKKSALDQYAALKALDLRLAEELYKEIQDTP
ncbi:MAG TPA: right-handed parallel beta-helix repeat-containing protein [Pyrinomonadaceae bacterium]|nr:right-handed parallel beta-helix repeat-containing protein [Pyrinomonadaceae bacterium]